MKRFISRLTATVLVTTAVGCMTMAPAPGADQVKITHNSADVAGCKPAGNIKVSRNAQGDVDIATAETEFRNLTVGLGGNTAFVTAAVPGLSNVPIEGIAYHCP